MPEDPRKTARGLIALAADKNAGEQERATAAFKAVALIHKHDLLSPSKTLNAIDEILNLDNDTVRAVKTVRETAEVVVGAVSNPEVVASLGKLKELFKRSGDARKKRRRR